MIFLFYKSFNIYSELRKYDDSKGFPLLSLVETSQKTSTSQQDYPTSNAGGGINEWLSVIIEASEYGT